MKKLLLGLCIVAIFLISTVTASYIYRVIIKSNGRVSLENITANWETYTYSGETDTALVIRWSHLLYHVIFWRNYIPLWIHNNDNVGFYFGWVEAAPYEPMCDDDRQYMTLTIMEQDSNHIKVEWVYDLTTFGGDVYHGDTQITEDYTFYSSGLATREVTIVHGSDWQDGDRKKNGYEVCEWAVHNPAGTDPSQNVVPTGNVMEEIIDPWNSSKISYIYWDEGSDAITGSYSITDYVNWDGQIHQIYSNENDANPFVIFGKDSMPSGDYYPDYIYSWTSTIESCWHWPAKSDSYGESSGSLSEIRSKNLPTHTMIVSYQFDKQFETIDRIVGPFKWLIGMGNFDELDLRELARTWLETGDVPVTIPTTPNGET